MKILQISSAGSIGGGERHLIDLVGGLVERGHEVAVAVRPGSPVIPQLSALPPGNIHTVPLRNSLDLPSAFALRRFVRERSINVIHAHLGRDYPLASFALCGSPTARLVLTRHVLFALGWHQQFALARAAAVIAVSEAVRRSLLDSSLVAPGKIQVIPNGIDVARFSGQDRDAAREFVKGQLGLSGRFKLVGSVGSLISLKGHEDLIRAAAVVTQTDPATHFVIIGNEPPGNNQTVAGLRELITKLGLSHRVHLLRGQTDVARLLPALDLFVSASHSESFGLAIVEAMAAGCAVLATSTAGAREVLEDEQTGRLTPVGDVDAISEAIKALLADPELRIRLGIAAQATAAERFGLRRMVEETERSYRQVSAESIRG